MPEPQNGTILSYAKTCFTGFDELPFNEVDSCVFADLSYVRIHEEFSNNFSPEGMPIRDLLRAEYFEEMFNGVLGADVIQQLMIAVCCNPRYRDARIRYYRFEDNSAIALQFAAMVFSFGDELHYVCFRGTDTSIHGWKEDMLLLMSRAAPGQMMAVNYLNDAGAKLRGKLIVGGHSKGGNFAVYASAHCNKEVQERISIIYNLDGPGFTSGELRYPGMVSIKKRVRKFIPAGSPVGLFLWDEVEPKYIRSKQFAALQHFPDTWETRGNFFVRTEGVSTLHRTIANNINRWAETVSNEEKEALADLVFSLLEETGTNSLGELFGNIRKYLPAIKKSYNNMDSTKRAYMFEMLKEALAGKPRSKTDRGSAEDDVDWDEIEELMKDYETRQFGKDYDLFIK